MAAKTPDQLLARLDALGIKAETHTHAPVLTVDAMMAICGHLPGAHTKNLFLRDAKKRYFLVALRHDALLDLKSLRHLIGAKGNLSFASSDSLSETLGVVSGAVSPFAIINDSAGAVTVCLEQDLMQEKMINFHPLTSDRTTSILPDDLLRFLEDSDHPPVLFALPSSAGG